MECVPVFDSVPQSGSVVVSADIKPLAPNEDHRWHVPAGAIVFARPGGDFLQVTSHLDGIDNTAAGSTGRSEANLQPIGVAVDGTPMGAVVNANRESFSRISVSVSGTATIAVADASAFSVFDFVACDMRTSDTTFRGADEGFRTANLVKFNPLFVSHPAQDDVDVSEEVLFYSLVRGLESFKKTFPGFDVFTNDPSSKFGDATYDFLHRWLGDNDQINDKTLDSFKGTLFSGDAFNARGVSKKGIWFTTETQDTIDAFNADYGATFADKQLYQMSPELYAREKWRKFASPGDGGDEENIYRAVALYAEALYRSPLNILPTVPADDARREKILQMVQEALVPDEDRFRHAAIDASKYHGNYTLPFARVLEVGVGQLRVELLAHAGLAAFGF